jgi:hypothetical protein
MDFIEAIELLINKKSIRRKSWDDKDLHIFISEIGLMTSWMYKGEVKTFQQGFSTLGDLSAAIGENATMSILATDWEEYFELHTFEKALKALKDGKKVKQNGYDNIIYISKDRLVSETNGHIDAVYFFEGSCVLASDWIII